MTRMASNGDLTRAVESGSYKSESDDRLRELIAGALDIGGSNPTALHRINHAADILKKELAAREADRREKAEEERNRKIEGRLEELRKPHWTVLPNFWLTTVAAIAAVVAAMIAWLAWKQPVFPAAPPPAISKP